MESYFKESTQNANDRNRQTGPIDVSQMSPDIQRALFIVEKQRMEGIVKTALDKDDAIAYNMKEHSPEGQNAIRKFVADKIQGRLDEHLKALGTPGQRNPTGLGVHPGSASGAVYPTKMPDHVPSTAGEDFDQHILELLNYHKGQD